MPVLADVFEEVGVKSVAINFIEDLHGIEYSGEASKEFSKKGIEVRMIKSTSMTESTSSSEERVCEYR